MNNILNVGSIPVGLIDWEEFEQYKEYIISTCLSMANSNTIDSNVATEVKHNLWESNFQFLATPEMNKLNNWLTHTVTDFVNTINNTNYHVAITDSWAHVTSKDGHHEPHRHVGSSWSGIFYVSQDDTTSGQNIFFNYFNLPKIAGYEFFDEQFTVDIIPGRLVIFPSTMLHYAKPYSGIDKRIVIAFNCVCI